MTAVTDKDGLLTANLKPGDYTVRELLNDIQKKSYQQLEEVKVNIKSEQEASVHFDNVEKCSMWS